MPTLAKLLPEMRSTPRWSSGRQALTLTTRSGVRHHPARSPGFNSRRAGWRATRHVGLPVHAEPDDQPFQDEACYIRQIPLLGRGAESVMARSVVVIVGLGGLGSFAAVEFAHLGIGTLIQIQIGLRRPT